jgi:hypothetical protein
MGLKLLKSAAYLNYQYQNDPPILHRVVNTFTGIDEQWCLDKPICCC